MYLETGLQMPVEADCQITVIGTSKKKSHFTQKIWGKHNAFGDLFFFLLLTKNRPSQIKSEVLSHPLCCVKEAFQLTRRKGRPLRLHIVCYQKQAWSSSFYLGL